jgi:hypothetical protein
MYAIGPVPLPKPPKVFYITLLFDDVVKGYRLYQVLCQVSSTGMTFMESGVVGVCTS